jgi:hypothetical protein
MAMMATGRSRQHVALGLLLASVPSIAKAQEQATAVGVQSTSTPTNTEASATQAPSPKGDVPLELWSLANSLLSSYYPSTTISDVASLTWPSVVVIESSTYTRNSATASSTTSPTTLATVPVSSDVNRPLATDTTTANNAEPTKDSQQSAAHPKDRTLGIALGVVFGVLTVAVMIFALCCVDRRQKKHGGNGIFPRRKRPSSPTDSEVGAWRARHPHMGFATTITGPMSQGHNRPPREWVDRYNRLADQQTPPAHMHPAFMHQHTNSPAETNPFFTPTGRSIETTAQQHQPEQQQPDYHPSYPQSGLDLNVTPYRPSARHSDTSYRHSHSSDSSLETSERRSRPVTPFSPMMMMQASMTAPPAENPFASEYDERQHLTQHEPNQYDESEDIVSPMQSPTRRQSPMVHYPSWSEVSEFNFSGDAERSVRAQRSGSEGGDGYRYGRDRESVVGRTELA